MKPVIILPDGVGVRNFVLGSTLKLLSAEAELCVLHLIPTEHLPLYADQAGAPISWEPLSLYHEPAPAALLRYTMAYAHLHLGNTHAMHHQLRAEIRRVSAIGSWRTKVLRKTALLLGRALASANWLARLDRLHANVVSRVAQVEHYRQLFKRLRPTVLFCSHQRPLEILPPVLAARQLGVPTATFIFSWDNLSSKGRIAAPFDHFLVWSDLMRRELLRFYPEIAAERVHIVGTPQFDPYADASLLLSRAEFFARVGADPARPLLCYSGGDPLTAPEDQHHVRALLELIRAGSIRGNPQVILRPTPVDEGDRFSEVRRAFPELIYSKPAWLQPERGNWARAIPLPEDVQLLANLTRHADININLASTMTLDFALHDRPVVNVAFDVAETPVHGTPYWELYYKFEHYRPVVELGAARFARSRAQLAQHINDYLADPSLDRAARRRFVELEVGAPLGESGRRILAVLKKIGAQ